MVGTLSRTTSLEVAVVETAEVPVPQPLQPGAVLPDEVDVVLLGAGHNGLVCAGYLAAAGLQVLVLEARPVVGGNTVTEELTLPGFRHDSCSSAHVLVQSNPLLLDDEPGPAVDPRPAVRAHRPGRGAAAGRRRRASSCTATSTARAPSLARWSPRDADAFRALVTEWTGGLAAVHGRWSSGLPLGGTPQDAEYLRLKARSAWDVVHERFEHPVVRSLVLWLSMATIQDVRRPGTGVLPSSITAGRLRFGWSTPIGGSVALPEALLRQARRPRRLGGGRRGRRRHRRRGRSRRRRPHPRRTPGDGPPRGGDQQPPRSAARACSTHPFRTPRPRATPGGRG
ncbi:hypothetical protein GCM10025868_22610 [Angustibacter aerolatus]|uniref:Amine oxidase domain-containing protein n=1 Tax=Angustibacter aerolatus TaxID=1162965 RepID=A0ABQ6JFP0_9ACTN|nr:NAD(P)-binding protein [Angustibacter aerolatus]GMA87011.1 hypothetical protein GCM10025868_22610 [Angustibacter aerolatus]